MGEIPPEQGEPSEHGSNVNEIFSIAWLIASSEAEAIDLTFWNWVRMLADSCRTSNDWQQLLAALYSVSLDPRMDKTPIYNFRVGPNPAASHGLIGSTRRRKRTADGTASVGESGSTRRRAAARRATTTASRQEKRRRLRALLDGAAEETPGEERALSRWLLDDAEALECEWKRERELLAEELLVAMRKFSSVAKGWKPTAEAAAPAALKSEMIDDAHSGGVDVLRATAGGASTTRVESEPERGGVEAESMIENEVKAPQAVETVEDQLKRMEAATSVGDVVTLTELLLFYNEDVCVRAALAISDVCLRNEASLELLSQTNAIEHISTLLQQPFSEQGLRDLLLVLTSLAANKAHHPLLIEQLVRCGGVTNVVQLIGVGGTLATHTTADAVSIVRSLADIDSARAALIDAGILLRLLRLLLPATPSWIVEPAAAAIAVLLRNEVSCRAELLQSSAMRSIVALLSRGGASPAAVSGASCITYCCMGDGQLDLSSDAKRAAHDAQAVASLVPLLDGGLRGNHTMLSAAEAAAKALATLCRGSVRMSADLRVLGGLQTLLALLGRADMANSLLLAVLDTLDAAISTDYNSGLEFIQLGGINPLAILVKGGPKQVASAAMGLLDLMRKRSDPAVSNLIKEAMQAADGLPHLVSQLVRGTTHAARAVLRIYSEIQDGGDEAIQSLLQLGAVPRLVDLLRAGPRDEAAINALGVLEQLWLAYTEAQDEAREAGIFIRLLAMVGGASEADEDREGTLDDVQCDAVLALNALVKDNRINQAKAEQAGAEKVLIQLLDKGEQSDLAALAIEALKTLGRRNLAAQEDAVRALTEAELLTTRLHVLRVSWNVGDSSHAKEARDAGSKHSHSAPGPQSNVSALDRKSPERSFGSSKSRGHTRRTKPLASRLPSPSKAVSFFGRRRGSTAATQSPQSRIDASRERHTSGRRKDRILQHEDSIEPLESPNAAENGGFEESRAKLQEVSGKAIATEDPESAPEETLVEDNEGDELVERDHLFEKKQQGLQDMDPTFQLNVDNTQESVSLKTDVPEIATDVESLDSLSRRQRRQARAAAERDDIEQ